MGNSHSVHRYLGGGGGGGGGEHPIKSSKKGDLAGHKLRGLDGRGDTPMHSLNLSEEGEGERGKEYKRKDTYHYY